MNKDESKFHFYALNYSKFYFCGQSYLKFYFPCIQIILSFNFQTQGLFYFLLFMHTGYCIFYFLHIRIIFEIQLFMNENYFKF